MGLHSIQAEIPPCIPPGLVDADDHRCLAALGCFGWTCDMRTKDNLMLLILAPLAYGDAYSTLFAAL